MIKRSIPNLITLGNLLCGVLGILVILVPNNSLGLPSHYATLLLLLAALLDFMDGASARLLGVSSEMGKQLDSLADAVTFGVLPGFMVYKWLEMSQTTPESPLVYIGLLIPLLSVYRLAKFNIDDRQTSSFIGLPTPANALFFASFWLIQAYQPQSFVLEWLHKPTVVIALTLIFSYLLIAELPLFSLKFKSLNLKKNSWQFIFLGLSLILIISFYFTAIPFIILLYLLISVVKNIVER